MTYLLPLVEELADCRSDGARADWLLRVPDGVVMRDFESIRVILQRAGFLVGLSFLRQRHAVLHATRLADGDLPPAVAGSLLHGRRVMAAFVRGAALTGEGEAG